MTYGLLFQRTKLQTRQIILKPLLRIRKTRKLTQMPTLLTAATASGTRTDQFLSVTPVATPVRTRTLTDKTIRGAIYVGRKDVCLQGTLKKSVTSIEKELTIGSLSFSKTTREKTERMSLLTSQ